MRDSKVLPILVNNLLLPDLGIAIGVATKFRLFFRRARLIQAPGFLTIVIHSERADENESLQTSRAQAGLKKVAGRYDRVHERIRKRLLSGSGGQMKDDGHVLASRLAIRAGEEITLKQLDLNPRGPALHDGFDRCHITGGPCEADQISKPTIQQTFDDARAYKTRGPCYQYRILRRDDEGITCHQRGCAAPLWLTAFMDCSGVLHAPTPQKTRLSTLSLKAKST
jgi:hypothetical protein